MASLPREAPSVPRRPPPKLKDSRGVVKRADVAARAVITFGGVAIIIAVLLILFLILIESVPIWRGAKGRPTASLRFATASGDPVLFAMSDPYMSVFAVLRESGIFQRVDPEGARVEETAAIPGLRGRRIVSAQRVSGRDLLALGLDDGAVLLVEARMAVDFSPAGRVSRLAVAPSAEVQMLAPGRPVRLCAADSEDEGAFVLSSSGGSDLFLARLSPPAEESEFPVAAQEPAPPQVRDLSPRLGGAIVTALAISENGREAVVATERGDFIPISFDSAGDLEVEEARPVEADPAPITSATFLLGGQAVVFGDAKGRVSSWFRVREPDNPTLRPYRRIHTFDSMPAAVTALGISTRNKGFVTGDAQGRVWLRHNTSEQTLLRFDGSGGPISGVSISPPGTGLYATSRAGTLSIFEIQNPHPETTLKTLFGKVFYEGYEEPQYSWQSTGGTDDFEPKFSLTPLIFGTLKATLYALLFAIPVAIAAALYASTFAHPAVRQLVKPVVEIMAALPSVVIGFLAGLWLAPLVERTTVATLLMLPIVPLVVIGAALGLKALPERFRTRIRPLSEMLILVLVVVAGAWLAYRLGPFVERTAFGGDFKAWLFEGMGLKYDPRNSLVIGFAMGFAVIPIIFTISEDAFSNVPSHLSAASLALGASRWQTAVRVIVPTASPGVFSAVMIGFGRAVGETMIVLMATGNTPIMEWSIFNGMRTLSANIAVEIPEAPFSGTLYRVLFFAAAILFAMTFAVNTLAEIVRQRLRRKYEAI